MKRCLESNSSTWHRETSVKSKFVFRRVCSYGWLQNPASEFANIGISQTMDNDFDGKEDIKSFHRQNSRYSWPRLY
jgi:hypothetical protein